MYWAIGNYIIISPFWAITGFWGNITCYLAVTDPVLKAIAWVSITCRTFLIVWTATKSTETLVRTWDAIDDDKEVAEERLNEFNTCWMHFSRKLLIIVEMLLGVGGIRHFRAKKDKSDKVLGGEVVPKQAETQLLDKSMFNNLFDNLVMVFVKSTWILKQDVRMSGGWSLSYMYSLLWLANSVFSAFAASFYEHFDFKEGIWQEATWSSLWRLALITLVFPMASYLPFWLYA